MREPFQTSKDFMERQALVIAAVLKILSYPAGYATSHFTGLHNCNRNCNLVVNDVYLALNCEVQYQMVKLKPFCLLLLFDYVEFKELIKHIGQDTYALFHCN